MVAGIALEPLFHFGSSVIPGCVAFRFPHPPRLHSLWKSQGYVGQIIPVKPRWSDALVGHRLILLWFLMCWLPGLRVLFTWIESALSPICRDLTTCQRKLMPLQFREDGWGNKTWENIFPSQKIQKKQNVNYLWKFKNSTHVCGRAVHWDDWALQRHSPQIPHEHDDKMLWTSQ